MEKVLVSACLAGVCCRYDGEAAYNEKIISLLKDKEVILVCPEILGGLSSPRSPCNIHGGDGDNVIEGTAQIIGSDDGKDYTESYLKGSLLALEIVKKNNIQKAILKSKSPTCGYKKIYDPSGEKLIEGNGVFVAMLNRMRVDVTSDNDF